jgi:hypothetical protein
MPDFLHHDRRPVQTKNSRIIAIEHHRKTPDQPLGAAHRVEQRSRIFFNAACRQSGRSVARSLFIVSGIVLLSRC